MNDITYLGWQDVDKKRPFRRKLGDALAAYREKHGRPADIALLNPEDALLVGDVGITLLARSYVHRNVLYVGEMRRHA